MPSALEVVREIHTRWTGPGAPPPYELFAEDIEYVNPPNAIEPGTRRGHAGFEEALRQITEALSKGRIEVHEIVPVGAERVLVSATFHIEARGSGIEGAVEQGYVWTVRDGKATQFRWFQTREEARAEAGLD